MKHIIGLDIGTNSIGWALIKEIDDGRMEIVKIGTHIFPIGTIVDDVTGKEKTKNEQRRQYRGASRMRYRYKLRRKYLKELLSGNEMLPDFTKYYKVKDKKQSFELYKLRADAIDKKIPLTELGRIFLLLNKHRGFQSNAKKLKKEDEETGKVKEGIAQLEKFISNNKARTIGEYFFKMHEKAKKLYNESKWHNYNEPIDERAINEQGEIILFNSNGIRRHYGRYTLRDMYKIEFDLLWAEQKKHYPKLSGSLEEYKAIRELPYKDKIESLKEFRKTLYWQIRECCIYYQRPLKSQKKYVSNCQFEKNKKVIPASHPLYQEFRIYKQLTDIRFNDEENINQPLKKEWVQNLVAELKINDRIYLKPSKHTKENNLPTFFSILNLPEKSVEFLQDVPDSETYIYGNRTYASFYEALGKDKFEEFEENGKLELLWHHLYISKDGLMNEDEWLMGNLTEDIKWKSKKGKNRFDDEIKWKLEKDEATKLIYNGLEDDYGSYSSKVIKGILPFMRNGDDEYTAKVKAGYLKSEDEVSEKTPLKESISQLKYLELRNPVVERAVSQTIKVINAILLKHKEIDRDKFEIRIESTREFKKPRKVRENIRRTNTDKEKIREEYANFLNSKREELGFRRKIEKYDSLINKYELWLEMGMDDNDGRFNENDFKAFAKITKPGDKLKHKLWKECNRICPYSNKVIPLSKLFTPEIEIEHIIPLSRSLDDSFINKTLTFYEINKEKGSRTAYEYMSEDLNVFKRRLKGANFSKDKINQFLKKDIKSEFTNDQITNTSYIAKYVRKKMQEVCRKVQFTNGSATAELRINDWKLSNLIDKIRYMEETGKDVDEIFENYFTFKNSFLAWLGKKNNTIDNKVDWSKLDENEDVKEFEKETKEELTFRWKELNAFNQFRNKSGKKDRSDHRHHAVDAFIIACCSPQIIKTLSRFNAIREEQGASLYDRYGNLTRGKIDKLFNNNELRNHISSIIVSHNEKQTLIKKRINRIKTKDGIIKAITYAPQGNLHEEFFYGKRNGNYVRRVRLYDDKRQDKTLFEEIKDLNNQSKGDKWDKIPEQQLYKVVKNRMEKFGKKALSKETMEKEPFFMVSPKNPEKLESKKGKTLPVVKSVRLRSPIKRSMIQLPTKDEDGNIVPESRWVNNESNYLMIFYKNSSGKRFAKPLSFFESVRRKQKKEKFIPDEIDYRNETYGIDKELPWLKIGDIIFLCLENETIKNIKWDDKKLLSKRLFKVKGFSSSEDKSKPKYGVYEYSSITLQNIKIAKVKDKYKVPNKIEDLIKLPEFPITHAKFNAIKVRLNSLGEIVAKGQECSKKS